MSNVRHAEFKLAKQTGATAHFARVSVEVGHTDVDRFTISAPDGSIRGWGQAVRSGAQAAVRELRRRATARDPVHVDVTTFMGMPTDTSDDDANWAKFMAVIAAFPELPPPSLVFVAEEDNWAIAWPE